MLADFKVIYIFHDSNPYPMLLGIYWAIDMNGLINIEKWKIIFEKKSLCVVVPLHPAEGLHYTEPVCDYDSGNDLDCIYKITTQVIDWVNRTTNGQISWEREISST